MSWRDPIRRLLFLPDAGSTLADRVDDVHFMIIGTTLVVGLAIGVVTLFFLIRYRRRGDAGPTRKVVSPRWLEALFVSVPLTLFLAWGVKGFVDYQWAHDAPPDALDVYVSAKQWMWEFSLADGASDIGVLRVPAGKPVRLLITSRDVIHSFYVPAFRLKQDALPGRYTSIWFEAPREGRYPVYCAEYCGLDHSHMQASVEVMSPAAFERWREGEHAPLVASVEQADLARLGAEVAAEKGCLKCHSIDGSAHIGPSWLGLYGREEHLDNGQRVLADEKYLTESMMEPNVKRVAGFNAVMPSFMGQLKPAEVAELLELIKSLRTEPPRRREEPVYVPR